MTTPSLVRATLQELASHRAENEVVFEHVSDYTEVSRIIRSYCVRLDASEIRIARCGTYFWVRLLGFRQCPYDLLMRSPHKVELYGCRLRRALCSSAKVLPHHADVNCGESSDNKKKMSLAS